MPIFCMVMGNVAFGLNALSFWMKDIVLLRVIQVASSVCFIAYSATVGGGPLYLMIAWSCFFMGINVFRLVQPRLTSARAGRALAASE